MRKYLFLFLFAIPSVFLSAQSREIDSLLLSLNQIEVRDSTYVDALNQLAFQFSMSDQKQSIYYINQSISLAKELGYDRGLIRAITIKGNSFLIIGLPEQALSYYFEALSHAIPTSPQDQLRLYNNIGEVFRRKNALDSSIAYFHQALELAQQYKSDNPAIIYSNLGEVFLGKDALDTAEYYFNLCLENASASNHLRGIGYGYYGLAECAHKEQKTDLALRLMYSSIRNREKASHTRGLIQSYIKIGEYYLEGAHRPDSAIHYWNKAALLAKNFEASDLLNDAYNNLYRYYLDKKDPFNAAIYLEKHKNLGDSLRDVVFVSNIEVVKTALQADLVNAENRLLKQQQEQLKAQEEGRLVVIVLALFLAGGIGYSFYQYRKRQQKMNQAKLESRFTNTLLDLSNMLNKTDLDLDAFAEALIKYARSAISSDRASYWTFDEDKGILRLEKVNSRLDTMQLPQSEISLDEFPIYFKEFIKNRTLSVSEASKDERLSAMYSKYFKVAGIESILNAPIIVDGRFYGLISFTMLKNRIRSWTVNDERFVASLVDLLIAAIAKHRSIILETEKEELIEKLKIRNKSLQEFNSVISHNLREPLTQIIGFSNLLSSDDSAVISNDIIGRIGSASNRIDKVIKELSTVLNESDPKPSDYRLISIETVLSEVLDLLEAEVKSSNITIEQQLEVKELNSFKPYLIDAFYHILSNALKFSDPSRRLQIKIKSYEDELNSCITISDNGRGVNLNKVGDKLFKMYQRFHLDVEGRGMGLFIVGSRINALNGWVKFESEEGLGTAVTIELPKEQSLVEMD